jgi:hypothetical protein
MNFGGMLLEEASVMTSTILAHRGARVVLALPASKPGPFVVHSSPPLSHCVFVQVEFGTRKVVDLRFCILNCIYSSNWGGYSCASAIGYTCFLDCQRDYLNYSGLNSTKYKLIG